MSGACGTHGEMRNACKILVGNPEGKRPVGRPKCRWEGLKEIVWSLVAEGTEQWRPLVNTVMNLGIP
jgi:hypothetical protein